MKISRFIFLILCSCLFLTGCWDRTEIDDRNYAITMGIDKYEEGDGGKSVNEGEDKFTVSLSFAELEKTSGNKTQKENEDLGIKMLSAPTVASAMKLTDLFSSSHTYFGQLKCVVFGEELLKDEKLFKEALDTIERDQEINMKIIILATDGKAIDGLKAIAGEGDPSGLFIWDFYKNNSKGVSATKKLDFETMLISLRKNGNLIIPLIRVEEGRLCIGGSAIVKGYNLVGYFDELQERGSLWVEGDAEGAILSCNFDGGQIPISILRNSCDIEFEEENEKIICNIDVEAKGNVEGYIVGGSKIFDDKKISELEVIFEEVIKIEVNNTIDILKNEYDVDALDFVGELKKKENKLYTKQNFDDKDIFRNMEFRVNVDVDISGVGMIK